MALYLCIAMQAQNKLIVNSDQGNKSISKQHLRVFLSIAACTGSRRAVYPVAFHQHVGVDVGNNKRENVFFLYMIPVTVALLLLKAIVYRPAGRADDTLVYTNVPKNALSNLHNHTWGKENRPFTYENGKQIWW